MLRPFIANDETLDFLEKIIAEEMYHIQELHKWVDRDVATGKITSENESEKKRQNVPHAKSQRRKEAQNFGNCLTDDIQEGTQHLILGLNGL